MTKLISELIFFHRYPKYRFSSLEDPLVGLLAKWFSQNFTQIWSFVILWSNVDLRDYLKLIFKQSFKSFNQLLLL
jgi:hypothetical protein